MKIELTRVYVDDQAGAAVLHGILGFAKKADFFNGPYRWLTVVSAEQPDGTELQLERNDNPAARAFQQAMLQQGQPATMFYTGRRPARLRADDGGGWCIHDAADEGDWFDYRHGERHLRQSDPDRATRPLQRLEANSQASRPCVASERASEPRERPVHRSFSGGGSAPAHGARESVSGSPRAEPRGKKNGARLEVGGQRRRRLFRAARRHNHPAAEDIAARFAEDPHARHRGLPTNSCSARWRSAYRTNLRVCVAVDVDLPVQRRQRRKLSAPRSEASRYPRQAIAGVHPRRRAPLSALPR